MIQVTDVSRESTTGRVLRLEILFDHHMHFVFSPNKKGEPELVAWAQIPNNSRYWLGKIWTRAHAIFRSESVPVIESESSQLILKF